MKRWWGTGLAVVVLQLLVGCKTVVVDIDDLCSIYQQQPQWADAARQAESRWGVPQTLLMAVIRYESSFVGDAEAPRRRYFGLIPGERLSTAYGYSQALDQTWAEYRQRTQHTDAERDDFSDAIHFVGWYLNRAHRSLQIDRDDGYHLYLAYHEGHRGFLRRDYEQKERLRTVARNVEATRRLYQRQLNRCRAGGTE